MPCMLGLDVLENGLGDATVPGVGVRQAGLGAGLARHQHRRGAALHQRQHLQHSNLIRVTSDTSFKEGYFIGAFSILPDTSFLLWT